MRKFVQILEGLQVPYHTHDCEHCVWYGSFVRLNLDRRLDLAPEVIDVWVHYDERQDALQDSIILRKGSDGPEYESYPRRVANMIADFDTGRLMPKSELTVALGMIATKKTHRWAAWEGPYYDDDGLDPPFEVDKWCRIDRSDDHGGRYTMLHVVSWPSKRLGELTAAGQVELLKRHFPSTFCQHAHDCCGHYYASSAQVRLLPSGRHIVRQDWSQNV